MIKSLGYSDTAVGYIFSIPALLGVVGMVVFSRRSDRTGERVWHLIVPLLLGGVGLLLASGVWLYAVRGEAILMDLWTTSARMLCL